MFPNLLILKVWLQLNTYQPIFGWADIDVVTSA